MLIDFHVNSSHSPGAVLGARQLTQRAKEAGLDGLCLTDVHTLQGLREFKEAAALEGLTAFVGLEAHTERGHFLAFFPRPEALPEISTWLKIDPEGKMLFASLEKAVESEDGILIAVHPFNRDIPGSPGDALVQMTRLDAIEVLDASQTALVNELAEEVAVRMGLPGVGGSHARKFVEEIGHIATLVRGPVRNEAELIRALRAHDVWPVAIGNPAFPITQRASGEGGGERSPGGRSRDGGREGGRGGGRSDRPDSRGRRPERSGYRDNRGGDNRGPRRGPGEGGGGNQGGQRPRREGDGGRRPTTTNRPPRPEGSQRPAGDRSGPPRQSDHPTNRPHTTPRQDSGPERSGSDQG